jgi:hypothetical protein
LGLKVQGLGFRVQSVEFRIKAPTSRDQGFRFVFGVVWGSGYTHGVEDETEKPNGHGGGGLWNSYLCDV